ncbi:MAG TPA: hypothetical protein VKX17_24920 [Planctomycetota bacterium]|nr:hypothetical protein [Planctomycetota bacterium]
MRESWIAELDALLLKLDDEALELGEVRRLNELLATYPAARRRYRLFIHMDGVLSWEHQIDRADAAPANAIPESAAIDSASAVAVENAAIVPECSLRAGELPPRRIVPARTRVSAQKRWRNYVAYSIAAAVLLVLLLGGVHYFFPGAPITTAPVAAQERDILEAGVDPVWGESSGGIRDGEALNSAPLVLRSGLIQVRLRNGVSMIVEGPAQFQLLNSNLLLLNMGRLSARVPARARGFSVQTSSARIVDLGTEFGVEARADGSTHCEVFLGTIEAHALRAFDSGPATLTLSAGDAADVLAESRSVDVADSVPEDFVRDLTQARYPIKLANTGIGLNEGDDEPNWRITKKSFDPAYQPQQAVVKRYDEATHVNDPKKSQWISTTSRMATADPVGYYTFQTHFDMNGLDPATAVIHAHVLVDDGLVDVLINGNTTGENVPVDPGDGRGVGEIVLRGLFKPGINTLDFVVYNKPNASIRNPVMLRVEFNGRAAKN